MLSQVLSDPEHILHVEDDDADAALVAHLLRGQGFRLARVRTYGEMLSYSGNPDVVLLDLRIPGSNDPLRLVGDAVRRFRSAGIILLTGIADREGEDLSVRAMAEGAQIRLIKATFDGRRLQLSIREAYQQRQHMIRVIEQSRADMRIDPDALQDTLRTVLQNEFFSKMNDFEQKVLRKFRKLGVEDTRPIQTPPELRVNDIAASKWSELLAWVGRHDKLMRWIIVAGIGTYVAVSDYVTGIRNAVFETRERVEKIERQLDEAR